MSNISELIMNRRSCRKFTTEPVSADDIKELQRAALASPTSKNCKSWQFLFVQDKQAIVKLSESKEQGAAFVKNATLAIVVFGDPRATDVWIEDASIAGAFLLLQAQALGLGATWVQLRERGFADGRTAKENIRNLTGAPEELEPVCIIAIGHPDEQHRPYSDERLPLEHLHMEKF